MKMLIGKILCGLLLSSCVLAQDVVVHKTQNFNVKIGSDTYHAVYDKTNEILVVTKNKSFRLGPLTPPKEKEIEDVGDSVDSSVSEQAKPEAKPNPFSNLLR